VIGGRTQRAAASLWSDVVGKGATASGDGMRITAAQQREFNPFAMRKRRNRNATFLLVVAATFSGCFAPEGRHTLRFELTTESPGAVVSETQSYFLWGLIPTVQVDVLDKCPYGVVAIIDGAAGRHMWFPTLGLWSQRSTIYYCRQPRTSETTS
jgi:hypothetical protein